MITLNRCRYLVIPAMFVSLTLLACGDDGGGGADASSSDSSTADASTTADAAPPADAFFVDPNSCVDEASVMAGVFTPAGCTSGPCHDSTAPARGLDLTSPAAVVGMTTSTVNCDPTTYISAGDPTLSLLVDKTGDTPSCGSRMPLGRPPLSSSQVACLENWISGLP